MRITLRIIIVTWLATISCRGLAQSCSDMPATLDGMLRTTKDPETILRSAAILGEKALPPLQARIPESGKGQIGPMYADPDAATDVALAKLNDKEALRRLQRELGETTYNVATIDKLAYVGSDAAIKILLEYFIKNRDNPAVRLDFGDSGYSPADQIHNLLIVTLPNFPKYPADSQSWLPWWDAAKSRQLVAEPELGKLGSQTACFARLAIWRFKDGVTSLYQALGSGSTTILRDLMRAGGGLGRVCSFGEFCGYVQTTLAKSGDDEEFGKIAQELESGSFEDAIQKLKYISGKPAFSALLSSLHPSGSFLPGADHRSRSYFEVVQNRRKSVLSVLPLMVKTSPLSASAAPTQENIEVWEKWWSLHKDEDVFK